MRPGSEATKDTARSAPLFTAPTMPLHAAAVSALSAFQAAARIAFAEAARERMTAETTRIAPFTICWMAFQAPLQSPRITAMTRRMTPAITLSAPRTMSLTTGQAHCTTCTMAPKTAFTMGASRAMSTRVVFTQSAMHRADDGRHGAEGRGDLVRDHAGGVADAGEDAPWPCRS